MKPLLPVTWNLFPQFAAGCLAAITDDKGHDLARMIQGTKAQSRLDLANLRIQRYGDTAITSYTLLISTALSEGVKVAAHNESRVRIKLDGVWKVVHVHKSPRVAGAAHTA